MSKTFLFILLLNVLSFSTIIHWQDTISVNTSISFHKEIGTAQVYNKENIDNFDSLLNCSNTSKSDFYFFGEKLYVCVCFYDKYAIGSYQPFFVSKTSIDSINFAANLDLNNNALFNKIDTIRNDPDEPSQCVKPHIHAGAVDSMCYPKFLVINTKSGYVLITYRDLWMSYQDTLYGTIKYYNKILIDSYLQDDNTLNFSKIPEFLKSKIKPRKTNIKVKCNNKPLYYDLEGKVISNPLLKNGIIIHNGRPLLLVH